MRVIFVLPVMGVSGGARVVLECGNWLASQEHQVTVVYPRVRRFPGNLAAPVGALRSLATAMGAKALDVIRSGRGGGRWFPFAGELVMVPSLSPLMMARWESRIPDADVIVATSWETVPGVLRLSERKGVKAYFVQHYEVWDVWNRDECWQEVERRGGEPQRWPVEMADVVPHERHVRRLKEGVDAACRSATKKITTSEWLKTLLTEKFGQNVEGIVRIGNNFAMFFPEEVPKPSHVWTVLAPYRGVKWKGDDDALEACQIVKQREPSTEIVMFGRKKPRHMPNWVEFHEGIDDDGLRRLYCRADVFLSPSWVEGFCLTPIEAMACGTACVITDVGAVREYAIPDETAVIVPPRDPKALAEACLNLLRAEEKRQELAHKGYESVKHLTWDKTAVDMESIFNHLLSPGLEQAS